MIKCPHCPKEIREDREYPRVVGAWKYFSNPDYDNHIKIHFNPHKK